MYYSELLGRDYQRRILISVYSVTDSNNRELVGNMSFGIKNLAEKNTVSIRSTLKFYKLYKMKMFYQYKRNGN